MNNDLISRSALKESIRKRLGVSSLKYLTEQEKVIVDEIDNAPPIETTIEDVMSMLSEDSLEATECFKVDTPSGKEFIFEKRRQRMNYCHYIGDNCKFNNDCENCEYKGNLEPASDRAKLDAILAIEHILCNFSRYERGKILQSMSEYFSECATNLLNKENE